MHQKLARALLGAGVAAVVLAGPAAAAVAVPAASHVPAAHVTASHHLPTIQQLLKEGKISPTKGETLLPRNNCTSNYESPFLYGITQSIKFFDLYKQSNNPPEMQAISAGGRTNFCFYVVNGGDYDVIQQANTHNCQFWNETNHVVDMAACNIASPSDQWEFDTYYPGQVLNKFNGKCMASEAPNSGPAVVYTTDGDDCFNGGELQTSWHSVP